MSQLSIPPTMPTPSMDGFDVPMASRTPSPCLSLSEASGSGCSPLPQPSGRSPSLHPSDCSDYYAGLSRRKSLSHPLVNRDEKHGGIYVLIGTGDPEHAAQWLKHAAGLKPFRNTKEIKQAGFFIVDSKDKPIFFFRDIRGSQRPRDDVRKVWTLNKDQYDDEFLQKLKEVQSELLGDPAKIRPGKATFDPQTGEWEGGIAFERSAQAVNLPTGDRSYPTSTSFQVPKNLDAPSAGRKLFERPVNAHGLLTRKLQWIGARGGMLGVKSACPDTYRAMLAQANYLNLPRIGGGDNVIFAAGQLNVADAGNLSTDVGRAGDSHIDHHDSPASPTCMINLTPKHRDVDAEFFFIFDLGIAIRIHEFTTLMFSGLHYHSGHGAFYRDEHNRKDPRPYVRLTSISYPPSGLLHGTSASALALHANGGVMKVSPEAKHTNPLVPWIRPPTAQATYAADGEMIFADSHHQFQFIVGSLYQQCLEALQQLDPRLGARAHRSKFFGAFTFVPEDERVTVEPPPELIGWEGQDGEPGTKYNQAELDDASLEELCVIRNSDSRTDTHPFGRPELTTVKDNFDKLCQESANTIPVCILAEAQDHVVGGKADTRKQINYSLRPREKEEDEAAEGGSKKRKRKSGSKESQAMAEESQPLEFDSEGEDPSYTTTSGRASQDVQGGKRRRLEEGMAEAGASREVGQSQPVRTMPRRACKAPVLGAGREQTQMGDSASHENNGLDALSEGLLYYFDAEHLTAFLSQVQNASRQLPPNGRCIASFVTTIAALCRSHELDQAWSMHGRAMEQEHSALIYLQHQRASIMIGNMILWEWLSQTVDEGYQAYQAGSAHWLRGAFRAAAHIIHLPQQMHQVDPGVVLPLYRGSSPPFTHSPHGRIIYHTQSQDTLTNLVRQMMMLWYGFSQSPRGVVQACLTRCLIDNAGVDSLWLPAVWEAYIAIGGRGGANQLFLVSHASVDDIVAWGSTRLRHHGICSSPTLESTTLLRISKAFSQLVEPFNSDTLNLFYRRGQFASANTTITAHPADASSSLDYLLIPGPDPFLELSPQADKWIKDQYDGLKGLLTLPTRSPLKAISQIPKYEQFSKVDWVPDARFVVDGKIWTAAGVTSGLDLAAAFAKAHFDKDVAKFAEEAFEYKANPDRPDAFAYILEGVDL
ncbi:hypothetical protein NMY22_g10104 [Coprinellus aureogranulatus]|nr:hypothetical protein NMY22_g10104 [Coprinellus aureogranulatus]